MKTINLKEHIKLIINAKHWDPFMVLGMHPFEENGKKMIVVRAFLPEAAKASVVDTNTKKIYEMTLIHKAGFFEVVFGDRKNIFKYMLRVTTKEEKELEFYDPYCFLPVLGDFDLYLIGEGTHLNSYEKLGAHIIKHNGIEGTHFAVWAPNAKRVSIIGDFNNWDSRRHQMRVLGSSGIWEIFIPGLGEGEIYKFEILAKNGKDVFVKSDPYAFYSELRPKSA